MLFDEVVETSRRAAAARGRREKTAHLAACLRRLAPEAVAAVAAMLSGLPRQGRVGVGPAALRLAAQTEAAQRPTLTVEEVDAGIDRVARAQGAGARKGRDAALGALFARATADEQDFLLRLLLGELRQGALEGLMAEAVAEAAALPVERVRRAAMVAGELGAVARAALAEGAAGLDRFAVELFRPLRPMLAQSAEDLGEALARLGPAALEYKLDGARIQVHKAGGEARAYSRRLNEVTAAVPEVIEAVAALPAREAILDGEAVALRADGRPQPFQATMRRFGRRIDVARLRATLPLAPYFFDCLALDGEILLARPQAERFAALAEALPAELVVPHLSTGDEAEGERFQRRALAAGHEGLMAKAPGAPYEAGRRGGAWLKIKLAETLDLVVLAAEWGHGRRQGWLSNLHLGARDPASGGFVMLGKTFKGMTDKMLAWQTERLQALAVARDAYTVYVRPSLVVEIAFNDIQTSPHYPGGLALRFARVKRHRPDKAPDDADTIERVREIHAARTGAE